MVNLSDIVVLLSLASGSYIDVYYNDEMGVFPTSIWDGYDNIEEQNKIIKKSLKLPKVNNEFVKKYYDKELKNISSDTLDSIYYDVAKDWCEKNNIKYN